MTDARTDEQLLAALTRGEPEALGALAQRYERSMLGLALGLLGGDRSLAMDAVQDVWVRVIRGAAGFRETSAARTWLYRILVNRCHDLRAARVRTRVMPIDPAHRTSEMRAEARDDLQLALDSLGPEQRDVLLVCYHDGMTHSLAADALGIPLGTLKSRLHAALTTLRRHMTQEAAR